MLSASAQAAASSSHTGAPVLEPPSDEPTLVSPLLASPVSVLVVAMVSSVVVGAPLFVSPALDEVVVVPTSAVVPASHAVDRRLVATCRDLGDARLELPVAILRRTGVQYEPVTRLLAHLFQHQIHHRGQAHAMLAGTAVPPPPLDEFFCANEAELRAAELAELGLSESEIWAA